MLFNSWSEGINGLGSRVLEDLGVGYETPRIRVKQSTKLFSYVP